MSICKDPEQFTHSMNNIATSSNAGGDIERRVPLSSPPSSPEGGIRNRLKEKVDPDQSTLPLAAFSFMTGFIDSVSFMAIFVWCGFQTGNFVQLAVASSRLFSGALYRSDTRFHHNDQQALTSFLAFNLGAALGRIGDRFGPLTRAWLVLGTFAQVLLTVAASVAIWKSGQPSVAVIDGNAGGAGVFIYAWTNSLSFVCIALLSASLGLQGSMAKKLNTTFGTTIVLTTIWCELAADPKLFAMRHIRVRDHKLIAASCIFLGAFLGCAIVGQIGAAGALGVGAVIRVLIMLGWMFVPAI